MKNKSILAALFLFGILFFCSCKKQEDNNITSETIVPVTITHIDTTALDNYEEVSGTVSYIVKTPIKSILTGYITAVNVKTNNEVKIGENLFSVKTKEAIALGNSINKLDSSLNFGKAVIIHSNSNGFLTSINVEKGNYIQEGDILAIINDANSYGVVINVPFELKKHISIQQSLNVYLPDGSSVLAKVAQFIPSVDVSSQMQSVFLKLDSKTIFPENLMVTVRIPKSVKKSMNTLPKEAVLSNETETKYWIMQLLNDSTAIKVPVEIGIKNQDRIEVLSPKLKLSDRILTSGNYGVGDTLKVKITNTNN